MTVKHTLSALFVAAVVSAFPAASEASFAKKIGSRYGGTLSSSTSTGTQQLAADPVNTLRGSTSTEYDPTVVRLQNVFAEEGFFLTESYVGVSFDGGETERLVGLGQFFEGFEGEVMETGYLQIFYAAMEEGGERPSFLAQAEDDFIVVDTDGEIHGDQTHTMLFNYIAENNSTLAKYRLYADDGSRGATADSLVSIDDPSFVIRDIAEANVAGGLIPLPPTAIPLPAALVPGILGLVGVGFFKKYGRKLIA